MTKYIVVLKSDCQPGDDVSFDDWSFEEACGIAAALNTGAVQEAGSKNTTYKQWADVKQWPDVWFGKLEDYNFATGFGIKKLS